MQSSKFSKACFLVIRKILKWVYPKIEVVGGENLPQESCVVVGNHSHRHGPLYGEFYFPGERKIYTNIKKRIAFSKIHARIVLRPIKDTT